VLLFQVDNKSFWVYNTCIESIKGTQMTKQEMHVEFVEALKQFSRKNYSIYKSDSYSAGYYESLVATMFSSLSKKSQKELLKDIKIASVREA